MTMEDAMSELITAWFIESGKPETPSYLTLNPGADRPEIAWTTNPFQAYRFPSKEMAQVYCDFFVGRGLRICLHELDLTGKATP